MWNSVVIALGAILLFFRFDWGDSARSFSIRSYLVSLFLFLIVVPVFSACLKKLKFPRKPTNLLTAVLALVLSFPTHLFGLKIYFYDLILRNVGGVIPPDPDWFPRAFANLPAFPGEAFLYLAFIAMAFGTFFLLAKHFSDLKRYRWIFLAVVSLIAIQTWLHSSLRSPYVYVTHYESPVSEKYWYLTFLYPDLKGGVNGDYHHFRTSEELFFGANKPLAPFVTRAFPAYLASQLTAYANPFPVWLLQNMIFWLFAAIALYALARSWFSEEVALFSGALMMSSQAIILYVAQPMVYATALCMLAITLVFWNSWVQTKSRAELFASIGLLFLFFLSYESHPWVIGFFVLAWVSGWNRKRTAIVLAGALLMYFGFLELCRHLPELAIGNTQASNDGNPIHNIIRLIKTGNPFRILIQCLKSLRGFGRCLVHNFQWVLIPALAGMYWMRGRQRKQMLALLVAPLLTYSYFELGEHGYYIKFPRLVMFAYPAIFMLAGYALARMWKTVRGRWVAGSFVVFNFIYLNIDVWGFPWIYFLWFFRHAGHSW